MNILLWIIFGGLAGWIASILAGTDAQMGLLGNVVVGIIGAFIGGWIADYAGIGQAAGDVENPPARTAAGFVTAVLGAVLLLFVINLIY